MGGLARCSIMHHSDSPFLMEHTQPRMVALHDALLCITLIRLFFPSKTLHLSCECQQKKESGAIICLPSPETYYVIKTWPIFMKIPFVLLRSLVCWCHKTGKIFVHMKYSQLNLYIKNVIHTNLLLYIIDELIINCFTVASQILWYMWYPRTQQSISHISMFLRHIQCTISYAWISTTDK